MNKQRRQFIEARLERIALAREDLQIALEEEQEAFDNIPLQLQESERGEAMQDYISSLDEAISTLYDAIETLNDIVLR